ncbi:response regulator [Parerythrobacter lacustris]|uniref:Response regulator n=1 Tax=Parerythrobacter lacustris TaxID=2969984 RepID=A0ABT1XMC8_9SPHN|nr:response regulator [Parerythrobacter lacustris]MCR2832737.1 response regulator [Parerythrobacter lacustris]
MPRRKPIRTALIVEDDAIIAQAMAETMHDAGIRDIRFAATTEEALAQLREGRPDALVLDVHLADRADGWSIAELVSVIGPNPPQIVFATGVPGEIPPDIARIGTVLEKPVSRQALLDALFPDPAAKGLV